MAYLWIIASILAGLLGWGLWKKGRIYEFPFLAGVTFVSFVFPQLVGLNQSEFMLEGALAKLQMITLLCASMCFLGYAASTRPLKHLSWSYDERRLLLVSLLLTIIGGFFFIQLRELPEEMKTSQYTGLPVAYLFFAELLTYGFAIAMLLFARTGSKPALLIALLGFLVLLPRMLYYGRRGTTVEFFMVILLAFWFGKQRSLPRPIMAVAIVLGMLALHSTGDYRAVASDGLSWAELQEIPWWENLETAFREGGNELLGAAYTIEAVDDTRTFDLGVYHWNRLVFNYVPAQIVGDTFKESLMIRAARLPGVRADEEEPAFVQFGYIKNLGSTVTGMTDAFISFWYFGCLKFFLIAFILAKVYRAAAEGNWTAQILYMLTIVPAMHAITHNTHWFFSPWVHMAVFLLPALWYARVKPAPEPAFLAIGARQQLRVDQA